MWGRERKHSGRCCATMRSFQRGPLCSSPRHHERRSAKRKVVVGAELHDRPKERRRREASKVRLYKEWGSSLNLTLCRSEPDASPSSLSFPDRDMRSGRKRARSGRKERKNASVWVRLASSLHSLQLKRSSSPSALESVVSLPMARSHSRSGWENESTS